MSAEDALRERAARALVSDDSRAKDQEDLLWRLYLRDVEAVVSAFGVPWPVLSWVSAHPEAAKGLAEGTMAAVPKERVAELRAELEATRAELARVAPPMNLYPRVKRKL